MSEISQELVERMQIFVRDTAAMPPLLEQENRWARAIVDEARAIVAELPEPVDPDLVAARDIAAHIWPEKYSDIIRNGDADESWGVRATIAAIRRGRELERSSPC